MKQYFLKGGLMAALVCLINGVLLGQANVQLQFVNATASGGSCPNGSPSQFCATLQIMGDADFQLGASSIWLEYDLSAVNSPDITPLNFDDDFDAGNYLNASFDPEALQTETPGRGEVQYVINTPSGAIPGAMTIPANTWTDVVEFCWDVVDANQTTGIDYVNFGTSANPVIKNTEFNNASPNNGTAAHTIVGVSGIDVPIECPTDIVVQAQVLLEGAYNNGTMRTDLVGASVLPNAQPYNTAPWNYSGTEQFVGAAPTNVVDWVLLSVTSDGTTAGIVQTVAALLLNNGNIVDATAPAVSGTIFAGLTAGSYQVIIRHRNHLDIVSTNAVTIVAGGTGVFDLTNDVQVINGFPQLKDMGSGDFAMKAGDSNGNSNVNASDNGVWLSQDADLGYRNGDFNMNANVNASDRSIWLANDTQLGAPNTAP